MARSPRAAITEARDALQLVLSCVTRQNILLVVQGSDGSYSVRPPRALELRQLGLRVNADLRPVAHLGVWRAPIVSYQYSIRDPSGRELLAYHWHPHTPRMPRPHLHLGAGLRDRGPFARAHLPTGTVGLADLVELLIDDLGIEPARPDWREVVAGAWG